MIRLFLYALVRRIIVGLAIFVGLSLLRSLIRALQGRPSRSYGHPQKGEAEKSKENYEDVRDAEFEELDEKDKKKGDEP